MVKKKKFFLFSIINKNTFTFIKTLKMNNANIYRIQQGQLNEFNHNSLIPNPSPFPDGQSGGGIGRTLGKVNRFLKKNQVISKTLGVAGLAASVIPGAQGFAAPLVVGSKIGSTLGYGALPMASNMGEFRKTQMKVKKSVKKMK